MTQTLIKPTDIQPEDKVFELIPAQDGFIYGPARYACYKAAWGTGKTAAGITKALNLSDAYDNNLGVVFRKEFTDLRDSTIKDFELYSGLKVNSSREVQMDNGSTIMFRHIEELNNLQNINLGWFWIEQAEELETDDQFFTLFGRLRRAGIPQFGFLTANANGHNWIYKLFKTHRLVETVRQLMKENPELFREFKSADDVVALFEATTSDMKKHLSPSFLSSLEIIRIQKPKFYNRMVLNSDDEADTVNVIIQPEWVNAAASRRLTVKAPIRRIISIDVARSNPGEGDRTVFYAIENNRVLGKEVIETRNTMEIVGYALRFASKHHDIQSYAVDEIGVGSGVADRLYELKKKVIFVNAAQRGEGVRQNCFNRRAEIYLHAEELFQKGLVEIQASDEDLIEELSWTRFKTIKSNGVYQVEPKDDVKERYGRSPDHADALINGLWALPQTQNVVRRSGWDTDDRPKMNVSPDAM